MKFLAVAVFLVAATGVLAQNPYEYVDDALIQRVGQIIYEYDQKVAASRSSGNTGSFNNGAGYQVGKPEAVSRASNFDYNQAKPQQQVYQPRAVQQPQQQVYQPRPVQQPQQQVYQQKPVARSVQQPQQQVYQQRPAQQPQQQAMFQQFPVSRAVRQPVQPVMQQQQEVFQNNRNQRQFTPSAPVQRTIQEPQVAQKNSGFGYVLSEAEVIPRVAEFHFTDGVEDSQSQDSFRGNNQMSNRRY